MADEQVAYVLTQGEYSDYHIIGIYTDAEQVEQMRAQLAKLEGFTDIQVEEFPLNKRKEITAVHCAKITNDGSELYSASHTYDEAQEIPAPRLAKREKYSFEWAERGKPTSNTHQVTAYSAKSTEHALKIARDHLAMLKERGDIPV